jgi:hypothetical protein
VRVVLPFLFPFVLVLAHSPPAQLGPSASLASSSSLSARRGHPRPSASLSKTARRTGSSFVQTPMADSRSLSCQRDQVCLFMLFAAAHRIPYPLTQCPTVLMANHQVASVLRIRRHARVSDLRIRSRFISIGFTSGLSARPSRLGGPFGSSRSQVPVVLCRSTRFDNYHSQKVA